MHWTRLLLILLGLNGAIASAQPPRVTPRLIPRDSIEVGIHEVSRLRTTRLTPEEARSIRTHLAEYLERQTAMAPRSGTLRASGLGEYNDAVEQADAAERAGGIGPLHVGLARPLPSANRFTVDPAFSELQSAVLRSRLGREPSAVEVNAELRRFDARVERLNQQLARHRATIAKLVRSGQPLPQDLEAVLLGTMLPNPDRDPAPVAAGFRALFRGLMAQTTESAPEVLTVPLRELRRPRRPVPNPNSVEAPPDPK